MSATVDYYFPPQSPWAFLGHERFVQMLRMAGASARVLPADFSRIFAVSGGLPLGQRAPQRLAYRLVELQRFASHLGVPMNIEPQYFPVSGDPAARLIVACAMQAGDDAALALSGAVFAACWQQQRDIASDATLAELLAEQGQPAALLARSKEADVQERYDANTQQAIDAGVFGAPTYVLEDELFWGQDRLEFLAKRLSL